MLLCWINKAALNRRGGHSSRCPVNGRRGNPASLPTRLSAVLDKDYPGSVFSVLKMSVLWSCFVCHLEGLSLPAEYLSPLLLHHRAGDPASPAPHTPPPPSACLLHSPVEATLILGNVSCWFDFFFIVILFLFGRIYIYIYKYIDIYHYRIIHW